MANDNDDKLVRQAKALFDSWNQGLQNLGHHVFRGHQVDVVTPVPLEG